MPAAVAFFCVKLRKLTPSASRQSVTCTQSPAIRRGRVLERTDLGLGRGRGSRSGGGAVSLWRGPGTQGGGKGRTLRDMAAAAAAAAAGLSSCVTGRDGRGGKGWFAEQVCRCLPVCCWKLKQGKDPSGSQLQLRAALGRPMLLITVATGTASIPTPPGRTIYFTLKAILWAQGSTETIQSFVQSGITREVALRGSHQYS